jgi:hydroxyacylglutathione hydrolase
MRLKRIYEDALAQASYLIVCDETAHAIVVDPNRDVERYLEVASDEGVTITDVTETHIHADFVSGARELARRTGARLYLSGEGGPDWQYRFAGADGARLLHDGDRFDVGTVRFEVLHTPGHTPEHVCFLVTDWTMSDHPVGMLTGDFLFVGDVGRPDLLERAAKVQGTMEAMARHLFRSLRALGELPDYLQIWPGHGAGSACGKSLGSLPSTTLGFERVANWAFQIDDEESFVHEVLAGQPEPPGYFARMKTVNRAGPPAWPEMESRPELHAPGIRRALATGHAVIDVRPSADFATGHIPGALSMPMGDSLATWAGTLIDEGRDIVLLGDDAARLRAAQRVLALIGLDRVVAWAGKSARLTWEAEVGPLSRVRQIAPQAIADEHRIVIDVRRRSEWVEGHMPGARHVYLGDLVAGTDELPHDTPIALHCQGSTRASIAASILQANGFTDVANVSGGYQAWEAAGLPIERDRSHSS